MGAPVSDAKRLETANLGNNNKEKSLYVVSIDATIIGLTTEYMSATI